VERYRRFGAGAAGHPVSVPAARAPDPDDYRQGEARTVTGILRRLEAAGVTGQLAARESATVQCLTCRRTAPAGAFAVERLLRLEGASDPDDMLAVVVLRCPQCRTEGTLVLGYGPEASPEDADVLGALPPAASEAPIT
jgi:hypothetical protein